MLQEQIEMQKLDEMCDWLIKNKINHGVAIKEE